MTRVFISWSGTVGHKVGHALFTWLPSVIQELEPFISSQIDKGSRWQDEIYGNLEASQYGIVCVTQDSKTSPWLHFEAGALSQKLPERDDPRVATFLHHIESSEVTGPLSALQNTKSANKDDVKKLIEGINKQCARPLDSQRLEQAFELTYDSLKEKLEAIEKTDSENETGELAGVEPTIEEAGVKELLIDLNIKVQTLSEQLDRRRETPSLGSWQNNRSLHKSNYRSVLERTIFDTLLDQVLDQSDIDNVLRVTALGPGVDLFVDSAERVEDARKLALKIWGLDPRTEIRLFLRNASASAGNGTIEIPIAP